MCNLSVLFVLSIVFVVNTGFALGKKPNPAEREQEEYQLKRKLRPILVDVLKDKFLALSVNVLYVLQRDPILTKDPEIENVNLPGFGNKAILANKPGQITGFIERYARYRFLVLMVSMPLTPAVERSITHLLKEQAGLELGTKDTFNVEVLAEVPREEGGTEIGKKLPEEKKDEETGNLLEEVNQDEIAKQESLAKLSPDLGKKKSEIDPRMEAESSKHLIQSRKAYFNNDLTTALNKVIESININPYSSKSYEMLGSIYYRLKWYNLALSNWTKALTLDPDNKKLNRYIEKLKTEL